MSSDRTVCKRKQQEELRTREERYRALCEELERDQDELRALTAELTLAEARERRRIAEDLHDQTGQALTAARMQVSALQEAEEDAEKRRSLGKVRDLLEWTLRQTRSLTFELSCPVLYKLGLQAALRDLGERLEKENGVRFQIEGRLGPEPLAEDYQVLLYRVVRELLLNVVRHARARTIGLSLRRDATRLQIAVEDDGIGFDTSELCSGPTNAGGFGLFAIRERLHHLGGHLEIRAVPSGGTRASVSVPLTPPLRASRAPTRSEVNETVR